MTTIYDISNSQPEGVKRNQREKELVSIEAYRKRLEESYQTRVRVFDNREYEIQQVIRASCSC